MTRLLQSRRVASVVLVTTFIVAFGAIGGVVGFLLVVTWYTLPVVYPIAFGHVLLLALAHNEPSVLELVLVEAGFITLLISESTRIDKRVPHIGYVLLTIAIAVSILFGSLYLGLYVGESFVSGAIALIVTFAFCSYAIHRIELFSLGLLEVQNE